MRRKAGTKAEEVERERKLKRMVTRGRNVVAILRCEQPLNLEWPTPNQIGPDTFEGLPVRSAARKEERQVQRKGVVDTALFQKQPPAEFSRSKLKGRIFEGEDTEKGGNRSFIGGSFRNRQNPEKCVCAGGVQRVSDIKDSLRIVIIKQTPTDKCNVATDWTRIS